MNFLISQHREFDEIESRLRRREPLILESLSMQKFARRLPVEVISDPVDDIDTDPYEEETEMHRQLRSHQVIFFSILSNILQNKCLDFSLVVSSYAFLGGHQSKYACLIY